jgi:hypothetical protein
MLVVVVCHIVELLVIIDTTNMSNQCRLHSFHDWCGSQESKKEKKKEERNVGVFNIDVNESMFSLY